MPPTCWHVGETHFIYERITIAICFFCSLRSTCLGNMPMDENIQHDITQICIALLQKSAAGELKARQFFVVGESDEEGLRRLKELEAQRPKTKKEATALLLQAASHPDITMKDMLGALEVLYFRSKSASQTRQWVIQVLRDL